LKILFTYSGISNIGFNAFYRRPDSVDSWYIPIGICYLASTMISKGHEVDLMDLRYLAGYDEVERKMLSSGCHMVACSFQTPGAKYAYEVAKIAKRLGKITVAGGIHPTVLPDEVAGTGWFDHVVIGEGLVSLPQLVDSLENGQPVEQIIQGQKVVNLDEVPFPHYFPLYIENVIKKQKLVMMFTSRGCAGRCTFCQPVARKLFGKKIVFRTADSIISEVLHWQQTFGITKFMLVDDTFLTKRSLVREFTTKLIALNTGLTWTCNARANEIEEETLELIAKSGCSWICIGFESGSQKILDLTKKGTSVEQNYRAAALCDKYGIGYTANILVGIPGEDEEDYRASYAFIREISAPVVSYNWFVPYPGTELFDYCREKGLLNEKLGWDDYEMNKIKGDGIIKSVDYKMAERWEKKFMAKSRWSRVRVIERRLLALVDLGVIGPDDYRRLRNWGKKILSKSRWLYVTKVRKVIKEKAAWLSR
jgi:radical SAM superfamily enzyme YgiQ (UPF0313 family)